MLIEPIEQEPTINIPKSRRFKRVQLPLVVGIVIAAIAASLLMTVFSDRIGRSREELPQREIMNGLGNEGIRFNLNANLTMHRPERIVMTGALGVLSGQLINSSIVRELMSQLYEYDALMALKEWKNTLDQVEALNFSVNILEYSQVLQELQRLAQKKFNEERAFGSIVGFYQANHLNPSTSLISPADKAAAIYVDRFGGGSYDEEFDLIVPRDPNLVKQRWVVLKNRIAKQIGVITPRENKYSDRWKNTAKTIEELIKDSQVVAPQLKAMAEEVALSVPGAKADFGPNAIHLTKSKDSIHNKMIRNAASKGFTENQTISSIHDTFRGSLIAKTIDDLHLLIEQFKEKAASLGWEIAFDNHWETDKSFGYVGIHAKIKAPISTDNKRWVLGEMQFHHEILNDGTVNSLRAREHILYLLEREPGTDQKQIEKFTSATMLLYVAAFEELLNQ